MQSKKKENNKALSITCNILIKTFYSNLSKIFLQQASVLHFGILIIERRHFRPFTNIYSTDDNWILRRFWQLSVWVMEFDQMN